MANLVTIEMAHILWFVGLLSAIFGGIVKLLISQVEKRLEERFESMDEKFSQMNIKFAEVNSKFSRAEIAEADARLEQVRIERDLLLLRIEMADKYVKTEALASLRSEVHEARKEIGIGYEKIMDKLDSKVSRDECGGCRQ